MPEIGNSLESHAKEVQTRIREQSPKDLRDSIVVKVFKKGKVTGLAIEYDDRAENYVYMAMEYPKGGGKRESAVRR